MKALGCIIFVLLAALTLKVNAASSHDILQQADKLRSSSATLSKSYLLKIHREQLTVSEQYLYDYLVAFNISMTGNLFQAIEELQKLVARVPSEKIHLRSLASLVTWYTATQQWQNGLSTVNNLQQQLARASNARVVDQPYLSMVYFYNQMGDYQQAIAIARNLYGHTTSKRSKCHAQSEYLYARLQSDLSSLHISDFDRNIEQCIQASALIIGYSSISYKANFFLLQNKPQQALNLLLETLDEVVETRYLPMVTSYFELLAQSYLALGNESQSEYYARKILSTDEQYQPPILTALKILATISEKKGQNAEALGLYKQVYTAEKLKFKQEYAKQLAIQKAKLHTVEKNTEINLLDKENALLIAQAELAKTSTQNDRLFMTLIGLVAIVIFLWAYKNRRNNLKLRIMAQTDELTGAANRRHFNHQATDALTYCCKTHQPISFILFDLDFFKNVNDNFGHQTGDWALKEVVAVTQAICRSNDFMGRLGGEEFGILLPSCSLEKALVLAEQCRQAIAGIDSQGCGHQFSLSASFGVSDAQSCGYQLDRLFAGADAALYQCKDFGRNRVYPFESQQLAFALPASRV